MRRRSEELDLANYDTDKVPTLAEPSRGSS
jgi:hypothetical protein